jgi:pilus assembly protein CpaE
MRNQRLSRGAASVVVVGVAPHGMGLIRECLGTEAVLPTHATPYMEAPAVVRKTRPNVVVMGFDDDFDEAVRLGPVLSHAVNGLHMVAISEQADPERIRAAMRAGYRDYVVLPEDGDLLRRAVHESAYGSGEDDQSGDVVAIVGCKGGCGVSFLTVNLAAEMAAVFRACVVDLDFSMGDIAAFLDLQPRSSIHDVLQNLDRLDERLLAGSVLVHPSKIHVLAQPTELMELEDVRGEDVLALLKTAANAYQYVLVDCGGRIDEATLTATTVADLVLLVTNPTVVAVKNTWRRLQLMDRLGIDRTHIRLVVNKAGRKGELSERDIEQNLGIPVASSIAEDQAACHKAVNIGKLLRDVDKNSQAARDIAATIELITEKATRVDSDKGSRPFWNLFK